MSGCREFIALLATAYTNKRTVPLNFKSISDAVQICGEISLNGRIFKNVVIAQYGLKPGEKRYIDPALRSDYEKNGKTGFEIDAYVRILCEPADVEALRQIIWPVKKPNTVILFANGYRNWENITELSVENPDTKNQIVLQDNVDNGKSYWNGVDASFNSRRKAERLYYADGHHSITTSNHNVNDDVVASKIAFGKNLGCLSSPGTYAVCVSYYLNYPDASMPHLLHTTPNDRGFARRVASGREAGQNWLAQLVKDYPGLRDGTEKITVDVVAHSMGFAYAQGMIEVIRASSIRSNITWSGYYILAPENGSAGSIAGLPFEKIWQYGSDLGQTGADPMWEQHGVAPQAAVRGLEITTQKSGRAFIPKNQGIPKGFVESHSIGNYGWIFGIQNPQTSGYVTPR